MLYQPCLTLELDIYILLNQFHLNRYYYFRQTNYFHCCLNCYYCCFYLHLLFLQVFYRQQLYLFRIALSLLVDPLLPLLNHLCIFLFLVQQHLALEFFTSFSLFNVSTSALSFSSDFFVSSICFCSFCICSNKSKSYEANSDIK